MILVQRIDFTGIAYLVGLAIGAVLLYEAYQAVKGIAATPGEVWQAITDKVDEVKAAVAEKVQQFETSVNTNSAAPATPPEVAKAGIASPVTPGGAAAFDHPDQVDPAISVIFGGGA